MDNYSIMDLFHQETETQVRSLKKVLGELKQQPCSMNELEQATQAVHAVCGIARIVGLEAASYLAQTMKECFIAAQKKNITLGDEQIEILLQASDLLLTISGVAEEEIENWMSEHSLDLATAQKTIAAILTGHSPDLATTQRPIASATTMTPETTDSTSENQGEEITLEEENSQDSPSPPPPAPPTTDDSMMDLFRLEAEAQVAILNDGLLSLESNPQAGQALEALMRSAHSIKGAARIVGLDGVVKLAHVMEDCFVAAQNKTITLNSDKVDTLLQGVDLLQNLSQLSSAELPSHVANHKAAFAEMQTAIAGILNPDALGDKGKQQQERGSKQQGEPKTQGQESAEKQQETPPPPCATTEPGAAQDRVVRVSADNLNRIMGLAGESLIEANWLQPHADSMMSLKRRLVELSRTLEQLQDAFDGGSHHPEEQECLETARQQQQECLDFLSDRLTELELYAQRTANLSDRLYREVITSNMRPFADGVQSFPRMMRDLARKLNKQVKLNILGKATAVDRDILKKLEAPLTHILRNAVDHGIELPEERASAGKPPEGTIRLEALHRGGMLSITITDDGRGIHPEQLRTKIISKKLASSEMAAQMSDAELIEFLFVPGFSTAKQVTEISGRGVGLDIAKSMAQEVGGTVRAISQPGKGTSFHFQLPLTLSVVRTLLVGVSGRPYAIPLARIGQIRMIERTEISHVENRQYFTMNQQNIGLIPAHQVLELPVPAAKLGPLSIVTITEQSNTYGLVVDELLGEHDLVVRPLDPRLGKVPDISATSLLQDGSPVLIVDVSDMVRSMDTILNAGRITQVGTQSAAEVVDKRKKVLVVDDSMTVRETERKLLEHRGYNVDMAADGMEGWNAVRTKPYDLVITDIDMPRMNGIELVQQIRSHSRLQSLPIIVMSYRDREEDRLQGLEAGADYYLTKSSFHDDTLVKAVVDLISRSG